MVHMKTPNFIGIAAGLKDAPEKVTHPDHYNWIPGIECLDVVEHFGFSLGCAIKYIWRNGRKQDEDSVTDLKKAIFYIQREIERIEKERKDANR